MIPVADINIENIAFFYDDFYLSDEDIDFLRDLIKNGKDDEAIDFFLSNYMIIPSSKYQEIIQKYLSFADIGLLKREDYEQLKRSTSILGIGLIALLGRNFSDFVKKIQAPAKFAEEKLTDPDSKRAIINDVLSRFNNVAQGTIYKTQSVVLNGIDDLQKEFNIYNNAFTSLALDSKELGIAIRELKKRMRIKYSNTYKIIDSGNMVQTTGGPNGVRHYKLDYYIDLVAQNVIHDISRDIVEAVARANGERAVEYKFISRRAVKKDREICKEILNNKVMGKSLLALDAVTATVLGIMTVDEAKTTPDYAMGIYCRHGIVRLNKSFLKNIDEKVKREVEAA